MGAGLGRAMRRAELERGPRRSRDLHRIASQPLLSGVNVERMVKTNLGRKDSALPYANMKFATHVTRVQHVKCDTKIWHKYALSCRKIAKLLSLIHI